MAKKERAGNEKRDISPDELEKLVEDYRERLGVIGGIAKRMRKREQDSAAAQGMGGAELGLESLEKLINNLERAVGRF